MNYEEAVIFRNKFAHQLIAKLAINPIVKHVVAPRLITHLIITPLHRTSKIFICMFCFNRTNEAAISETCMPDIDFDVHVVSHEKGGGLLSYTLKNYLALNAAQLQ